MLVLRRGLFAVVTDEDWSRVAGLPVGLLNTVLAVIVAASVVAAMRIVGLLLVAAMMVLPVASGQLLARSFRGTLGGVSRSALHRSSPDWPRRGCGVSRPAARSC